MSEHEEMLNKLITGVTNLLERTDIDPDLPIGDMGFDSVNIVELLLLCEEIYGANAESALVDLNEFTSLKEIHENMFSENITEQPTTQEAIS
jgi:acyl carrier protein